MKAPVRQRWSAENLEQARRRVRAALESASLEGREALSAPEPRTPAAALPPAGETFRAAAVLSRFRLDDVASLAADAGEMTRLRAQSVVLREPGWRTLPPDLRNTLLRGMTAGELNALAAQFARNDDPLQAAIRAAMNTLTPEALRMMATGELAALVQVHDGLSTIVKLPPRDLVERKLQLARLLDPLRDITRTFSGRAAEMQTLRDYVGVLSTGSWIGDAWRAVGGLFKSLSRPPFLIHGVGGVGKTTLTAKFILEHALAAEKQQFPFAYLDFDRPAVSAEQAPSILSEAIRQIGLQYDTAFAASERLRTRWQSRLASEAPADSYVKDFAGFLETLEVREGPVLLVLDTFEEVQRRSSAYALGVIQLVARLAEDVPRLRVVIAGRNPIEGVQIHGSLQLTAFDELSAIAYLQNSGVDGTTALRVAGLTAGNPLTLTLAVELYRRDPSEFRALDAAELKDAMTQSALFDRILLHIPDPEVRKLAHPGLVLRRVTPEVIRDVLARPCGIDVPDLQRAEELFEKLAADTTLVTRVDARTLVHRPDVRREMLNARSDSMQLYIDKIHRAAIEFYRRDTDAISRAELAYHSLSLGESDGIVLARDLEPLLVNALDELPLPSRVILAEQYGLELPSDILKAADQETWERITTRKIRELIETHNVEPCRALLAEREERTPNTELMVVEAQTFLELRDGDTARALALRGIAAYREAGNGTALFQMLLVASDVERRTGKLDAAYSFLVDAEEIARRRNDPLMLVQVLTTRDQVSWTEDSASDPDSQKEMAAAAAAIPDEAWAHHGPLLRTVVWRVGYENPEIVARAIRIGALDLTDRELAEIARSAGCRPQEVLQRLSENPTADLLLGLNTSLRLKARAADVILEHPTSVSTNVKIKSTQRDQLRDLIVKHYGDDLGSVIEVSFSRGLESVSLGDSADVPRTATDLIRASEREGWLNQLIVGLWHSRFTSPDVLAFVDAIGLGPAVEVASGKAAVPEKRLRALLHEYRVSLSALAVRTFEIDIDDRQTGCGFLTGNKTMTSVAAAVPSSVGYTFDRAAMKGKVVGNGKRVLGSSFNKTTGSVVTIRHNMMLAAYPIDVARAAPDAPPRGAVTLPKTPHIDPLAPPFWLWRSKDGTFLSGVERTLAMPDERHIVATKASPPMLGAPCFDAALNVVGVFAGTHEDNPTLSIVVPIAQE